jgi:hypothetical protein
MNHITDIEQYLSEELALLQERISSADSVSLKIRESISVLANIKSTLDLAKEQKNSDNSVQAFDLLLKSTESLIALNTLLLTLLPDYHSNNES